MGNIIVRELEVSFHVGITEAERARPQRLLINLDISHDLTTAVARDDVRWTIDYDAVCKRLARLGERRSWSLIETIASEIADLLIDEFGARAVTVEVQKFVLPQTRYVAAQIARQAPAVA